MRACCRQDVYLAELKRHGALYRLITLYLRAYLLDVMQLAACNQLHSLE